MAMDWTGLDVVSLANTAMRLILLCATIRFLSDSVSMRLAQ